MITGDGNTTKAVTVVGVKVEEATAVADRVVGVAAVVEVVEGVAVVEVAVAVAEVGAEATAVAEVGVTVVEATAAEDFWVSSQRHRSQQDEKEKLRIPRATSASAYPVYNFPGHHKPPTRGTSAVHRKSNYRSR